jgi:hypothetical protein
MGVTFLDIPKKKVSFPQECKALARLAASAEVP